MTGYAAVGRETGGETPASRARRPKKRGVIRRLANVVRTAVLKSLHLYYRRFWGMDLHPTCRFSTSAKLDITNPKGVHIDAGSYVAFGAVILTHDVSRLIDADTYIGKNCFIGANAMIMPGVRIGDECIVGAGSVVTRDVPAHSICAGNPAKVLRTGIRTLPMGILVDAYEDAVRVERGG